LNVPFVLMSLAARRNAPQGGQSKAGPDGNAPHTEIGQLGKRKLMIEAGH
jgi:hypothetical protein